MINLAKIDSLDVTYWVPLVYLFLAHSLGQGDLDPSQVSH